MAFEVDINESWQSLATLTGLPVGTHMVIQNKSSVWVHVSEGSQPSADSKGGYLISPFDSTESSYVIALEESDEIWVRTTRFDATLFVQEIL